MTLSGRTFNTNLTVCDMLPFWLTIVFLLSRYADEPEGDGGEEQGVLCGYDRLGSQHLVAGNHQEHPGVDAAGKELSKCLRQHQHHHLFVFVGP